MFRKTLLARTLSLAFGGLALTMAGHDVVLAQSNATGNIVGQVENAADTMVTITNTATGLQRKIKPQADGRYAATSLPTGHYKVDLLRAGALVSTLEVDVLLGQGVDASFYAQETVKISARRRTIDVSSTNNGATFTAKVLKALPITPTVDSIIQLAPGTTRADSRYAAGASFGGGGASENAYYINGFPVTNPLSQLGGSELPFGAIAQAQILTGGFGAEFGRSIGGVVNIDTKSGSNNWEAGVSLSITPDALRARQRDLYYGNTRAPSNAATDNHLYQRREENKNDSHTVGAYVGGPLIRDKLFMFVAAETIGVKRSSVNGATDTPSNDSNGFLESKDTTNRYLGKFDWNLTDNHRLELTLIGDDSKADQKLSGYIYNPNTITGGAGPGQRTGPVVLSGHYENNAPFTPVGADIQILKYTGNLTPDLTLTSLYGQSLSKHINTFDGYDINQSLFQVTAPPDARAPGLTYVNPQPVNGSILSPGSQDKVRSYRLDIEYKLGKHTLRGGFDNNTLRSSNAGNFVAGGGQWIYGHTDKPNEPTLLGETDGVIVANGGGLGTQGYYVQKTIISSTTNAQSLQSAQYLEDRFQITKDILLIAGLRNESFTNKNGLGVTFLEQRNQRAPRFSASWDVNGDASLKVFGSTGRYHIQIPTRIAVRGASPSLYTNQFFTYTGVNARGEPTGLTPLTAITSPDNEFGQPKDALVVSATDLRPNFQDELTLGFEGAVTPLLNIGSKITYRKLKHAIDDFCDPRPFQRWARRNQVSLANWGGFACATFNPGEDNTFLVDFNSNTPDAGKTHTVVHLSKDDLGFPEAKRAYFALDLFAEHPLKNGWYGKIDYTWSRSKGNTEGQTLSDIAQADIAATQSWDFPELSRNADGLLPNNRTHQIKAFAYYEITPEWTIGGNYLMASGRPQNCLGNAPTGNGFGYGSSYFYCAGQPTPRGSLGNLPWDIRLDMNLVYKPASVKGLALKVDVFNVFNKQTAQTINEQYNVDANVSPTYSRVVSYTSPRSVRLTAEYNHKF